MMCVVCCVLCVVCCVLCVVCEFFRDRREGHRSLYLKDAAVDDRLSERFTGVMKEPVSLTVAVPTPFAPPLPSPGPDKGRACLEGEGAVESHET